MPDSAAAQPRRETGPDIVAAVVIAAAVVAVAGIGGLSTDTDTAWYTGLDKPAWQPPGWVFGPVWTVLYGLLAVSTFLAWRRVTGPRRPLVLGLYAANYALNLGWTLLFFAAEAALVASLEILALLATIVALAVLVRPYSRAAAWALVPYGLWVTYAATLSWAIVFLN
ncbi:MAG: tryptophan-rich sensory protein [Solirubrobacterales bacterium]|nr:tryptophan-rich sensory protein [Solirubrobacterales bacterium]